MHLQQTKAASRTSGGPQYYFHEIPEHIKKYLRQKGACRVVLQTPYGIAKSDFMAVGTDHKLDKDNKPIPGSVGHDRIQQASGNQSIGEAIRQWYSLKPGDFERIDVETRIHNEGHFILTPTAVKIRDKVRTVPLAKIHLPLSLHKDHVSTLWREQLGFIRKTQPDDFAWLTNRIEQIVDDHAKVAAKNLTEPDILRAAGPLSLLGMDLSAYLGSGYDCPESHFKFQDKPSYPCPVEIKKRSEDFKYQVKKYKELPRAVVLCMTHSYINPPEDIDVLELSTLLKVLQSYS